MQITLTDFIDFVAKTGTPRLTHVRKIKERAEYNPMTDYWKGFREAVVQFHESGGLDTKILLDAVDRHKASHQNSQYAAQLECYRRFLNRKTIEWKESVRSEWTHGALTVKINPELHLVIAERPHVIKLYLRADPLPKKNAEMVSFMMHYSLSNQCCPDTEFCILDVPRNKLYVCAKPPPPLLPLLKGEAMAFAHIWESLDE